MLISPCVQNLVSPVVVPLPRSSSVHFKTLVTQKILLIRPLKASLCSVSDIEILVYSIRQEQEQLQAAKREVDLHIECLHHDAEVAAHCIFQTDLDMGHLAILVEKLGYKVEICSPTQRIPCTIYQNNQGRWLWLVKCSWYWPRCSRLCCWSPWM